MITRQALIYKSSRHHPVDGCVMSALVLLGSSQCVIDIRLRRSTFSSFRSHVFFSSASGYTQNCLGLHLQVAGANIALFLRHKHDWRNFNLKLIASGCLQVEIYSCQTSCKRILNRREEVPGDALVYLAHLKSVRASRLINRICIE